MAETDAERKLAAEALKATAPDPKGWVQHAQIWLAFIAMIGALLLSGWLIIHGPPSPKAPSGQSTEKASSETPPAEETKEEEEKKEEETSETTESSSEGESLANLSKQGPWAFVIVALLAAVFLATGKTLNVGGQPEAEAKASEARTKEAEANTKEAEARIKEAEVQAASAVMQKGGGDQTQPGGEAA
jgi:hypothetical protein